MTFETHKAPFATQAAPLIARVLLCGFYLIFAVIKLNHVDQTIASMARLGTPSPELFAWVAILIEGPLALLLLLGVFFRPLCLLFFGYTIATGIIGHAYWAVPPEQYMGMFTHFYKNVAIAGGFLALYAIGAGRFSLPLKRS
ncbi:DoxX family protein [Pseudomonas sp. v388]|uniref:DoxX family protein n=1 Tax=Pseudomonas sp. v388 TaxID=2479849 RepID=UPI000F7BA8FC|nr:DoxX family protein [Pseudomonas sp. v388]RRV10526.1 DoxX family protein [Pseudomonas sp. v388]